MKKLLSVVALLLTFGLGASAQDVEVVDDFVDGDEYKKAWDFTQGLSDETIANLTADKSNWAENGTDGDGNVNNWKNAVKQDASKFWKANGQVIEELRDLKIDIGSNKDNSVHLATTKLRLTRKSTKLTFHPLKNGQKIKVVGRSANSTATNRGIAPVQSYIKFLPEESSPQYNGACIFLGNQVEGSEGTYTFVWQVVTEETEPVDVQFQLTPDAGIDFTLFQIDNGDAPAVEDAKPVAYLYSGSTDEDYAYLFLDGASDRFALEAINVDETTETAETLLAKLEDGKTNRFQAVVVSPTIGADNAYLPELKKLVAFMPMLNLNPNLYEALGYGKAVKTEATTLTVSDVENPNAAFEGFDVSEGLALLTEGGITGVELGDYFANDDVIAKAGETVAMHIHNAKRNAYMLLPLTIEDMLVADADIISTLIPNALQVVVDTKKDVQAVGTPVITPKQENGYTTVTITASNSKEIYYTLDGTDPTVESTVYAEPFMLTEPTTVKAFAIGDGYTDSKIAEKSIVIMVQAAAPEIAVTREAGKSTITLSSADEGVSIYFNFSGITTADNSQLYTEPIELTEPATITVLVSGGDFLPSDIVSKFIGINGIDNTNIRMDEVLHFDANQTDWFINDPEACGEETPKASAYYFWGKSAWNYYDIEHPTGEKQDVNEDGSPKYDDEGQPVMIPTYDPDPNAVREILPLNDNGWKLRSAGQVLTGELTLSFENAVGNGRANRYADEAIDFITTPTKGCITFGAKQSGEPYTASIETTKKIQAPFDVVVLCGNGNSGGAGVLEIQVSANGEEWTSLGELKMASTQRYIKRTRVSYDGSDEVFVRVAQTGGGTKAQVYDIIVLNHGEESAQYSEETMGVSEVKSDQHAKVVGIYSINGVRTQQLTRGLNIVVNADGSVRKVMSK